MDIGLGMHVVSSDDQDVGSIDHLILDPDTHQVKAAVVGKGMFTRRDTEVPRDLMVATPEGPIRLSCSAEEMHALPEFLPGAYTTPPPDLFLSPDYPSESIYLPFAGGYGLGAQGSMPGQMPMSGTMTSSADSPDVREAWRRQDLENAVVQAGSAVLGRDGAQVGEVHQLNFDQQTGELTHIVVRKGFLFTKDIELPASAISRVSDRVIVLIAGADQLKDEMGGRGSAQADPSAGG